MKVHEPPRDPVSELVATCFRAIESSGAKIEMSQYAEIIEKAAVIRSDRYGLIGALDTMSSAAEDLTAWAAGPKEHTRAMRAYRRARNAAAKFIPALRPTRAA